ncbi:MAG TPA: RtcB family protein, partial [Clostridiales bacterium]|nr:RtcB family protein [Clostridiales bacterium]
IADKVVPNLVGVDIGCGVEVIKIFNRRLDLRKLDRLIHERIPCGFQIRSRPHAFHERIDLNRLKCKSEVNLERARRSIGTLGGGNHFIEANQDGEGNIYIVIHSGSRHLGNEVARLYQEEAFHSLNMLAKARSGGEKKAKEKKKSKKKKKKEEIYTDIPKSLAYVSGQLFQDYIHDMKIIQQFAELNRKAMAEEIVRGLDLEIVEQFTTIHNYIDTENMILRKGAVSAQKGEKLLIPINMRDGSFICVGKGNPDWNFSAPHGAGRIMSRAQAKSSFTLSEFQKTMEGIYTTTANKDTIDECPLAYKPMEEIANNIADTVDILERIVPIYNFKAAE